MESVPRFEWGFTSRNHVQTQRMVQLLQILVLRVLNEARFHPFHSKRFRRDPHPL